MFAKTLYHRRVRLLSLPFSPLLSALISFGCGSGYAPYSLPVYDGATPAFALYHSYGDSITAGAFLPDPSTQAYPVLVAKSKGLTLTNLAISGDQACDVPTRQIFPAGDSPNLSAHGLYTLAVSTNDANVKGPGAYEAVFNLCHQATIAWLAVPAENKVLATSSSVSTSGKVSIESDNHWNALTTNAKGASLSIPFTRSAEGAVYVWYRIRDGDAGTFSYAMDGVKLGTGTTATTPAIQTMNGGTNSMALLRIPNIPAGSHTLTVTQTNDGDSGVGVLGLGLPILQENSGMPLVLVGTTPKQKQGGRATCDVDDSICKTYIADITANVQLLSGDGLNVHLFDTRKFLHGNPLEMADIVHPNPLGQIEIAHSLLDVLDQFDGSATSVPATAATFK